MNTKPSRCNLDYDYISYVSKESEESVVSSGCKTEEIKELKKYTDTTTGEPVVLTEDEFNNIVELFRKLVAIRDRTPT